ncbi:MAG: DUF4911 domain-containing protein [Desulfobacterales bacterium]|nr:DUF4911 domain-containing protein [Desulfobacterales bacterium]
METTKKYYRVERREISFLKFIIEAYDNMAIIRTVDSAQGVIALHISPGCETAVAMILNDLRNDILIEEVDMRETGRGTGQVQADNWI